MKVYHLKINVCRYNEERNFSGVYATYEKALEIGKKKLERKVKSVLWDLEKIINVENMSLEEILEKLEVYDYTFEITEIADLEYAENFDINLYPDEEYLKQNIKPTHIVNELNYKGELTGISVEYREKNTTAVFTRFYMKVEDFQEGAGSKFKIGDIVKVKRNSYRPYYDEIDKLYVVRNVPEKVEGQPYFNNKYALISIYPDGLFSFGWNESDIEKYEGEIEKDSPIELLQRIIKGELKVTKQMWQNMKNGNISFDTRINYTNINELVENSRGCK